MNFIQQFGFLFLFENLGTKQVLADESNGDEVETIDIDLGASREGSRTGNCSIVSVSYNTGD